MKSSLAAFVSADGIRWARLRAEPVIRYTKEYAFDSQNVSFWSESEGCYVCYFRHFLDRKLVKPPLFVQTIFGILGGIGCDAENLLHMRRIADKLFGKDYVWSILAAGKHQTNFVTTGAIMGGNVRVGLEDNLYIRKGELAKSNADQVRQIRRLLEELSLEVATPTDVRRILALKGADRVAF